MTKPPATSPSTAPSGNFEPAGRALHDDLSAPPRPRARVRGGDRTRAFGPVPGDEHVAHRAELLPQLPAATWTAASTLVLDALEASGQADRTVVIFTADHGDMVGSHGLRQKGPSSTTRTSTCRSSSAHPDVGRRHQQRGPGLRRRPRPDTAGSGRHGRARLATSFPALHGRSFLPALEGRASREGVLTAVENVANLDASFWRHFADPDVGEKIASGELRPDLAVEEHSGLVEEAGGVQGVGVRWGVAGQGVDVREQHPPARPSPPGPARWPGGRR